MADLESLNYPSITDMNNDEAIELLRQIRLSRRVPVKKARKQTTKKKAKAIAKLSAEQAAEVLRILGGK